MASEKIFKKCESFNVAYLQLRVKLHLNWAFFIYRIRRHIGRTFFQNFGLKNRSASYMA